MNYELAKELFLALAKLDIPLSVASEKAIDTVKDNDDASEHEKAKVKNAVKDLLNGYLAMHSYLSDEYPEFNFNKDGKELFKELRGDRAL